MPTIKINVEFEIGQVVYLKTDPDQLERIVVSIIVENKDTAYQLACGDGNSTHYDYEISAEKDVLKGLGVEVSTKR